MRRLIVVLIVLMEGWGFTVNGQQQAMFTQYMFNQLAINPAYAGVHEGISASLLWREQWIGFEGAPSTQTFSIHSPISFRPISMGGMIMRDKIGITNHIGANFSYAYRIKFGNSRLSFGLQASINNFQANYAAIGTLDPTLLDSDVNVSLPNFGSGILWHSDRYYLGFTVPQIINQQLDPKNPASDSELVRHYFIIGGCLFPLAENVLLKPNFLFKSVQGAPAQLDINMNMLLQHVLWLGISYRQLESFSMLVQLQVSPQFQIGYSMDFLTDDYLRKVNSGSSHEIMINYIFELPQTKILTPRYF
ncbi:MAG: type IX secretion system membrane protein PorP/SprF [Cyclobacteriaceae bacterium]|nr:type IX secretion system membrane protein PorP/SprF [Cyclobacteriaceae bacterium]